MEQPEHGKVGMQTIQDTGLSGILTVSSDASLVSHPPEAKTAPDPNVGDKASRRQFAAKYKRRILQEIDRCSEPGQIGGLLWREKLYSSHIAKWRAQREAGLLQTFGPKKRCHTPR
jgi:transposase